MNETQQPASAKHPYSVPGWILVIGWSLAFVLTIIGVVGLGQDYAQESTNGASDDGMSGLTYLLFVGPAVGAFALLVSLVWCLCVFLSRHTHWHEPWGQARASADTPEQESTRA